MPTQQLSGATKAVPFFRPSITEAEIDEVVACLRSGWLTTGPRTKAFERDFCEMLGARCAVAVNSCTAALHLAVEALGLRAGQAVLVPTMTFAATAEIVRYQGATPVLVDCDPRTLNLDLDDAERKVAALREGRLPCDANLELVGVVPVHVGGDMLDMDQTARFAARHRLWIVEDCAHALPAAYRSDATDRWKWSGANTATISCFSFYANKTITTGEGGMAVTDDPTLESRMRQMSLHGLSHDAWKRYSGGSAWDYRILAPGYKYNLTDLAAAIGLHQLERAESLRAERERLAVTYRETLGDLPEIELPAFPTDRLHSWHLFPIRLNLDRLAIDRNAMMDALRERGVGCSVHWRPLHLHPYYETQMGWTPEHLPTATREWTRLITLPLFPGMRADEQSHVVESLRTLCRQHRVAPGATGDGVV